ncbi:MAG: NYN domain-containing protein [Dehalococcoidia bacterium]
MIFIDGSNLYHVLGQICGRHDLQFDKFGLKLANGRDLRRIYYYNIRQDSDRFPEFRGEQSKFLESLYDTPYLEVRLGIWKQRGEAMVEKGVDVMLATDFVTKAFRDQYDTAIIVSGDGDFYPAIQAVKDAGKHVEVAAFETNISPEAARAADVHLKLNKTFFTSLWMTKAQVRARTEASGRPEVTDEAASPNGEDKKSGSTSSRRRPVRASSSSTPTSGSSSPSGTDEKRSRPTRRRSTRSGSSSSTSSSSAASRNGAAQSQDASPKPAAPAEKPEADASREGMRRTPARRRVGGTQAGSSSNGSSTSSESNPQPERAAPRPPALRNQSASATPANPASPASEERSENGQDGNRRAGWLRRFGLNSGESNEEND